MSVLTRAEVAEALRIKIDTVDVLARRGDLPSFFLGEGRVRRYYAADVEAYVEACRARGAAVAS